MLFLKTWEFLSSVGYWLKIARVSAVIGKYKSDSWLLVGTPANMMDSYKVIFFALLSAVLILRSLIPVRNRGNT